MTRLRGSPAHRFHVMIVDDNPEVRKALRLLLSQESRVASITEAGSLDGMVEVSVSSPGVLLIDLELAGLTAEDVQRLRDRHAGLAIVGMISRPDVSGILIAAADRVLSKMDGPEALIAALSSLMDGAAPADRA